MKLTPFDWQLKDLQTLRRNNYTALLAMEAGSGKTFLATLAIEDAKPAVTLIIAPQSTHNSAWIKTLRDNLGIEAKVIGNKNKAMKEAMFEFEIGLPGIYLITPQLLARTDTSAWAGDMLIHDESHQGATPGSKIQRAMGGSIPADTNPLAKRFTHRLALSGTPMRQAFENLWGTMRTLWPDLDNRGQVAHRNIFTWKADRMTYETVYTNQRDRNGNVKTVKNYLTEAEPGRLISEMPCVIMHKRREYCCESHPNGFLTTEKPQVIERVVELTARQKKSIKEMNDYMMTWIEDNLLKTDIGLTQKQRVRQLTLGEATVETWEDEEGEEKSTIRFDPNCASPVVDEILHILDNLPEDEAVVVYTDSQKFAEVLTHRIPGSQEYSGKRKANLEEFGTEFRVLVGTVGAIGTGTAGLNKVCSTEIFADQPVSLTNLTQTTSRLDRLDSSRQVQRYVLLDDEGVQLGRLEDLWQKELLVRKSLRGNRN